MSLSLGEGGVKTISSEREKISLCYNKEDNEAKRNCLGFSEKLGCGADRVGRS